MALRFRHDAVQAATSLPDVYAWCQAIALADLVEAEAAPALEDVAMGLALARRGPMPDLLDRLNRVNAMSQHNQTLAQTPLSDDPPQSPRRGDARGGRSMAKLIVCREVGFDCDAEVRAETVDEALAIAAAHVTRDHGIADVTPDMVQVVVARIHDVPGGAPAAG